MTRIAVGILLFAGIGQAASPIRDEALRLRVLKAVFPDAAVSVLAGQREYLVVGPVHPDEESSAVNLTAADFNKTVSDRRRTEMRLFRSGTQLIAVISYSFDGANPARCCFAVGKIALLTKEGDRVVSTARKSPHAFTRFTNVQFIRDYSNAGELVLVGMNAGGAGNAGEESIVLSIAKGRLIPLAVFTSALSGTVDEDVVDFKMTLDVQRTHFGTDRQLWFIKSTKYPRKVERIPIKIGTEAIDLDE